MYVSISSSAFLVELNSRWHNQPIPLWGRFGVKIGWQLSTRLWLKNTMGKLMQDVLHIVTAQHNTAPHRWNTETYFLLYSAINFNGNAYSFSLSIDIVRIFRIIMCLFANIYMPLITQLKEHCEAKLHEEYMNRDNFIYNDLVWCDYIKSHKLWRYGGATLNAKKWYQTWGITSRCP